jgi:hypothetical protein
MKTTKYIKPKQEHRVNSSQ